MRNICVCMVAGILAVAFAASDALAQQQAEGKTLDHASLRQMLAGLGYQPERVEMEGGTVFYRIKMTHRNQTRVHMVAVDQRAGTIAIIGGGFASIPDPTRASNAWFRKLMKINHSIGPCYIFLNDNNVFGLTTVFGNTNVTPARLRERLQWHVNTFDSILEPLIQELVQPSSSLSL